MSKARLRKTGRGGNSPHHVRLYHTMMRTEAWRSLRAVPRAIYVEISMRYGGPGSNNGRIPYAVRDAAKSLKISPSTASAGMKILQDRGFIVATTKGSFSRKVRHATEWRLTEFSSDIDDRLPTRDYVRWSAKIQSTVSATEPRVSVAEPTVAEPRPREMRQSPPSRYL